MADPLILPYPGPDAPATGPASFAGYGGAPAWDATTGTVYDAVTGHPYGGGGVYSLLPQAIGNAGGGGYYTPGGNASSIISLLSGFSNNAFASLQSQGSSFFGGLKDYATQSTAFHASFADRMATIFEKIAGNSAKAPSGLFDSIF